MSVIYWPNSGEIRVFSKALSSDSSWSVCLYSNDWTPSQGDDTSDYVEADYGGYSRVNLVRDGSMYTDDDGKASQDYEGAVFTHDMSSAQQDIYGFYILDESNELLCASRLDTAPIVIGGSVNSLTVRVTLRLSDESDVT